MSTRLEVHGVVGLRLSGGAVRSDGADADGAWIRLLEIQRQNGEVAVVELFGADAEALFTEEERAITNPDVLSALQRTAEEASHAAGCAWVPSMTSERETCTCFLRDVRAIATRLGVLE